MTVPNDEQTSTSVQMKSGTGWLEIDADIIDWIDVIAQCYNMTTSEVAEQFLRHGAVNYERILDDF